MLFSALVPSSPHGVLLKERKKKIIDRSLFASSLGDPPGFKPWKQRLIPGLHEAGWGRGAGGAAVINDLPAAVIKSFSVCYLPAQQVPSGQMMGKSASTVDEREHSQMITKGGVFILRKSPHPRDPGDFLKKEKSRQK